MCRYLCLYWYPIRLKHIVMTYWYLARSEDTVMAYKYMTRLEDAVMIYWYSISLENTMMIYWYLTRTKDTLMIYWYLARLEYTVMIYDTRDSRRILWWHIGTQQDWMLFMLMMDIVMTAIIDIVWWLDYDSYHVLCISSYMCITYHQYANMSIK